MNKYLVVGRGLVGSVFKKDPHFDVVSHEEWQRAAQHNYRGIVCAAAISAEARCQQATMTEVMEANVTLPLRILRLAKARNVPCVVYSTAGVYKEAGVRAETDDVHPHNRYTASKVYMEHALQNEAYQKLYIFRIPFVVLFSTHQNDLGSRVMNWAKCEDVNASVVYKAVLDRSVRRAMANGVPGGIYNIASGIVHFPTFLEDRFNWRGDVVPAHSMGRTPNSQLNSSKAEKSGLLDACIND